MKCVFALSTCDSEKSYPHIHQECIEKIKPYFSYPEFEIGKLGYKKSPVYGDDGKFNGYEESYDSVPVDKWIENSRKIIEYATSPSVAYFRKVNFLFNYFDNKDKMVDEWFAPMTKEDCLDIIDCCKRVLENHDLAEELLPTREGFFFGSTEYDEYYFNDVEDVMKQFTEKVLPVYDEPCWEEGEVSDRYKDEKMNCYIHFSW